MISRLSNNAKFQIFPAVAFLIFTAKCAIAQDSQINNSDYATEVRVDDLCFQVTVNNRLAVNKFFQFRSPESTWFPQSTFLVEHISNPLMQDMMRLSDRTRNRITDLVEKRQHTELIENLYKGAGTLTTKQQNELGKLDEQAVREALGVLDERERESFVRQLAYRDMVRLGLTEWLKRKKVIDAKTMQSWQKTILAENEKSASDFSELSNSYVTELIELLDEENKERIEQILGTERQWSVLDPYLAYVQMTSINDYQQTIEDLGTLVSDLADSFSSQLIDMFPDRNQESVKQMFSDVGRWYRLEQYSDFFRFSSNARENEKEKVVSSLESLYGLLFLADVSYVVEIDGIINRKNNTGGSPRNTLVELLERNAYGGIDIFEGHVLKIVQSEHVPDEIALETSERLERLRDRAAIDGFSSILDDYLRIKSELDEASIKYIEDSFTKDQKQSVRRVAIRRMIGVCGLGFTILKLNSEFSIEEDVREQILATQNKHRQNVVSYHEKAAKSIWSSLQTHHPELLETIEDALPGFRFDEIDNATLLFRN